MLIRNLQFVTPLPLTYLSSKSMLRILKSRLRSLPINPNRLNRLGMIKELCVAFVESHQLLAKVGCRRTCEAIYLTYRLALRCYPFRMTLRRNVFSSQEKLILLLRLHMIGTSVWTLMSWSYTKRTSSLGMLWELMRKPKLSCKIYRSTIFSSYSQSIALIRSRMGNGRVRRSID